MSENSTPNHDEKHYQTLISIFKWMVGAIAVVVTAALWIVGSSLSSLKNDLKTDLDSVKSEIKEVKTQASDAVVATKQESNAQLELLRRNSTAYLDFTKEITQMQISILREDAKNLALSTARAKVEEAFRANNVQYMIEDIARKELGDKLDKMVEEEINKTTEVFKYNTFFAKAYEQIRWGDRTYIEILDSMSRDHHNETIRTMAKELLIEKGKDYDDYLAESGEVKAGMPLLTPSLGRIIFRNNLLVNEKGKEFSTPELLDIIYNNKDLYNVTLAFMALRNKYKVDLKTFDIQAVKEWEKSQKNYK